MEEVKWDASSALVDVMVMERYCDAGMTRFQSNVCSGHLRWSGLRTLLMVFLAM